MTEHTIPVITSLGSDAFSEDLKRRAFSFVGSTVIYAHMQAVGMVNDHLVATVSDIEKFGVSIK